MTICPLSWTTTFGEIFKLHSQTETVSISMSHGLWYTLLVLHYVEFLFQWYQAKFAAITEKFGREIRVFQTPALSPSSNEVSNSGMQHLNSYIFFLMPKYSLSLISYLSGQLYFRTPAEEFFSQCHNDDLFYSFSRMLYGRGDR
jgi:hypothetical protein